MRGSGSSIWRNLETRVRISWGLLFILRGWCMIMKTAGDIKSIILAEKEFNEGKTITHKDALKKLGIL